MIESDGQHKRITRRTFIEQCGRTAAAALPVMLPMGIPAARAAQSDTTQAVNKPPNIVLIMADDCSAREFACYGHPKHKTPNIDALAKTGTQFQTCWCTPICSPTRAMMMTGRYAYRTGWWHNKQKPKPPDPRANLGKTHRCFAHPLQQAGYATAVLGKWQLAGSTKDFGFDEYCLWSTSDRDTPAELKMQFDGPVETKGMSLPGRAARYWHPLIVRNDEVLETNADDYGPDIFTDFLLDFAARKKDQPFFAYYPMCLPHKSWDFDAEKSAYLPTPKTANGRRIRGRTAGSLRPNVQYIDDIVGRIVAGLEALGLRENTIIMFTCDNGTTGYGKARVELERGPRVPMIVNSPTHVNALGKVDSLISHVDMFATVCDLAGTAPPPDYAHDGHSFAPLLRGETFKERQWVHSYCFKRHRMLRDKRWLLDGRGQLHDCGDRRNEKGYKNVTRSQDPQVVAARKRMQKLLEQLEAGTALPTRG